MSATKAQLRNLVLKQLGVLAAGETADNDDAALVEEMIDGVHAELVTQEIAYWETTAIPEDVKLHVRTLVSARLVNEFGVDPETAVRILGAEGSAWANIRSLTVQSDTTEPVKADYF